MDIKHYRAAMEAVIFAHGEPITLTELAQTLEIEEEAAARIAEDLAQEYGIRQGGLRLIRLDDAYQFCTDKTYADYIRKAMDLRRNVPLSQAAMEVLAIVAYNQPVTRAFVEQVRGVDCDAVMQGLVNKALIEERGRLELPGRPLLYGTTPVFLRSFGIRSLAELPPLPDKIVPESIGEETTMEDMIRESQETSEETKGEDENGQQGE